MADAAGNILTVIIADPGGATRAIELAWAARALELASRDARSHGGTKTSGNIIGDHARVLGTWAYSPTAES